MDKGAGVCLKGPQLDKDKPGSSAEYLFTLRISSKENVKIFFLVIGFRLKTFPTYIQSYVLRTYCVLRIMLDTGNNINGRRQNSFLHGA